MLAGPLFPLHVRHCAANREPVPRNPLPCRVRHVGQRQGALGGERSLPIGQLIQTIPCHLALGQIAGLQPLVHLGLCAAELILGHVISQGQVSRPQVGSRILAPGLDLAHVGRLDIAQQFDQVAG